MKSFEFLCLFCLRAFRGERSISGIYHLFRGKKSSQTIQDANIFSLGFLYGLFPELNRSYLSKHVIALKEQGLITEAQTEHYQVTDKGISQLIEYEKVYHIPPYLNGFAYKDKSTHFWKRYSLLVQTLSNLIGNKKTFLPVQYEETVQRWVKSYLLHQKGRTKEQMLNDFYQETNNLLQEVSTKQATVFTLMLTGYRQVGRTPGQIARLLDMDPVWVQVEFQAVLHFFIGKIDKGVSSNKYPSLYSISRDLLARPQLTETTQKTMKLLNQGLNIHEISMLRRLKISTIEDHIVEIALHSTDFSIEPYVEEKLIREIEEIVQVLHTNQLRKIKERVTNQDISYFQIRLVLTRMGEGDESRTVTKN